MDICNIICIQTILMAFFMTLGLESWRFLPKFVTWKHELKCLKPVRCCTLTILLGATDNTKQALLAPWKGTFIKAQFVRVCCITSTQITPWNSGCLPLKNRGGLEDSTCFFIFTVFFFKGKWSNVTSLSLHWNCQLNHSWVDDMSTIFLSLRLGYVLPFPARDRKIFQLPTLVILWTDFLGWSSWAALFWGKNVA